MELPTLATPSPLQLSSNTCFASLLLSLTLLLLLVAIARLSPRFPRKSIVLCRLRNVPGLPHFKLVEALRQPVRLVRAPPPELAREDHPHPRAAQHDHRQRGERGAHPQDEVRELPQGETLLRDPRRLPRPRNLQRRRRAVAVPEEDGEPGAQQALHNLLRLRGRQQRNPPPPRPAPRLDPERRRGGPAGRVSEILFRQHLQILLRAGPRVSGEVAAHVGVRGFVRPGVEAVRGEGHGGVALRLEVKRLLNVGSERRLREAVRVIDVLAKAVIKRRREMGFSDRKDLLSRFMGTVHEDAYLRDIVVSFLLAGRDTVASALTSFFWLLGKHPEVESEIRAEADRVIGPHKDLTSFEQLKQLHYLQAATHESMRLFPPIQFDSKFCLEDDVLPDGTKVESGTRVTYHPYAMGRLEEIWGSDCLEFRPQRWLKDGVFHPKNPFKYPVFQAGLRVCMGKEMALMELKCVALSLLRKFHIELVAPASGNPRFSPGLTATFSFGLPVMLRERGTTAEPSR
ncbi:fatty acid omega-hydroxylase [Spatholobus suberectus]|nr:fatty acid omega-hydroxylase [Spatholobus suberectus]